MAKEAAAATPATGGKEKKGAKKKEKRVVPHGTAHIQASFNNTVVSIADPEGNVLCWSSAGRKDIHERLGSGGVHLELGSVFTWLASP